MFEWFRKVFNKDTAGPNELRPVKGAMVARQGNRVVYNMLDPTMQKFIGQCVGAIKKAGIKAKGTGQFSIRLGEKGVELRLDEFWQEYARSGDDAVFQKLVADAKDTLDLAE
jgi:hypothetical protein